MEKMINKLNAANGDSSSNLCPSIITWGSLKVILQIKFKRGRKKMYKDLCVL